MSDDINEIDNAGQMNTCCICGKPIAIGDNVTAYTSGEVAHDDCWDDSLVEADEIATGEVLQLHR